MTRAKGHVPERSCVRAEIMQRGRVCRGQEPGLLARLARVCQRTCAGGAWLIDYTVALAFCARERLRSHRGRGALPDDWSTEALFVLVPEFEESGTRGILRPGRVAASLGLIGVLSVSVAGALWRESAPAGAPLETVITHATGAASPERWPAALAWAPLVPLAPLVSEARSATEEGEAERAFAAKPAEVGDSPVTAAAVETPTPRESSEPGPAPAAPEPLPATSAPAPAVAPQSGGQLTRLQLRASALAVGWPEAELDELVSVAWCESRFHLDANGWGALGLMQIMPEWFESLGIDVSWAFDATTNLRVAYHIYQNDLRNGYGEWASWTCKPAGIPESAP